MISSGSRIHHRCGFPDCPLYGRVLAYGDFPSRTTDGGFFEHWALVEFDAYGSVPSGYRQWVPVERIEPA